jgi:adenylate cyclase
LTTVLRDVLPESVIPVLRESGQLPQFTVHFATVVQCDLRGFTAMGHCMNPTQLVTLLNELYSGVDECLHRRGLYKLEVVGDSVIACAGLFGTREDRQRDALAAVEFALDIVEAVRATRVPPVARHLGPLEWRVGVHSCKFVGGIVGQTRIRYHLLGSGMHQLAELEAAAAPSTVLCSRETARLVRKSDSVRLERDVSLGSHVSETVRTAVRAERVI